MTTPNETVRGLITAITEKSDDGLIRRTFGVAVKAGTLDEKRRCVRVIASTDSVDSYDEIVEQDWDKRLGRYKKNPVVLYNHNRVGFLGLGGAAADTLPVGYAEDVRMVEGHLEATLCFVDSDANPMAERVWQGFKQRSIRAVSVGFLPHSVFESKDNDKEILHLADNELYEISAIAIPANADAVALSAGSSTERDRLRARARGAKTPSAAAEPTEKTMDPKVLEEKLKAAETKNAELDAQIKTLETKLKTAEDSAKKFETELKTAETALESVKTELGELQAKFAAATTDKAASEAKLIEREVDDLVGKKIAPAEKADFIAIRTTNPELFKSMVKNRPDMPHTKGVVREQTKTKTGSAILSNASKKQSA